jgi:hypothetical protein
MKINLTVLFSKHKEINQIINSNNPFLYNYDPNFMDELYMYNSYPELDGQTFYHDSITNELKFGKPPPFLSSPE